MSRQQTPRFGSLLKMLRTAAGLTQEALAERAGLSVRGLQDLERGQSRTPRQDTVELLAAALGLSGWGRARFLAAGQARPSGAGLPAAALPPPFGAGALLTLAGRSGELALLERFLGGESGPLGTSPALLLAGEPGMGKTRLLQAAIQRAVAQGWSVLAGGCQRRGGQEPFAPVLDALAQYLHAAGPSRRQAALEGCAWLVRLLPELAQDPVGAALMGAVAAGAPAPEQERRLVFAAVARLLANVAGPAGTLLVLDDLQWAGTDALDLLATLLRAGTPVFRVVGAYRDTEVGPADPLGLLLADLAPARLARQHQLGPLAPREAADLLDDLLVDLPEVDRGQAETILRHAGGTPFFLVSYAQALHQGSEGSVPWDLAQGVRQRVALLPAAGQVLLGVAAVVGRHVPRALLLAVAGQSEEDALAGLEAACRARLLLEEGNDGYAFAHDLIRELVEADLGTARQALLHRKVAEALEDKRVGASPETLAYHYDRGGTPDKAARYLERAGDHAWSQRANAAAEGHYREALDRLDALRRAHDAARVREKLGEVLYRMGRYEAVLRVLERAAAGYNRAGDLEGLVRVTAVMGGTHSLLDTTPTGIALITALLERLERSGASSPPLATLYEALGWLLFSAGRYDAALAATERAAALARDSSDDRILARSEESRVNLLQMLGRLNDALQVGREVLPLAERIGDLECLWRIHSDLACTYVLRADFGSGRRAVDRALALAEQLGNPARIAFGLGMRSWFAVLSGDWPVARADLDRATAVSSGTDRTWFSAYLPIFLARLSLAEGAWDAATAQARDALALSGGSGDLQALRWAATTMAELDIREGRPVAARARLVPLLDRPGLEECDVTMLLPMLAWARLELGEIDLAADAVEQAARRARPEEMRPVLVEALRVRALIAIRRELWDEAARSLEEGLDLARAMPYPYAEARLFHIAGVLHAARGQAGPARAQLEAALALFRRLGAGQDTTAVERDLAMLSQNSVQPQEPAPSQNWISSQNSALSPIEAPPTADPQLTDAQWALIAALLPPPARTGRPRAGDRAVLEAILYRERTGCAWAGLPAALGDGATAHRRLRQWQAVGLWAWIAAIARTPPPAEGG